MAISVVKGQKSDLTKTNPGLSRLTVGIGWEAASGVELDTSAFLLGSDNKVAGDEDFIFYNQPSTSFITYMDGGQVGGEKKQFAIDLGKIPARIEKIAFSLTIHDGEARRHHFGQVQHGFLRFANAATGQEVMRYDLGSGFTVETAIVIGELYRHNGEWKFNAIGSGFAGGLNALCANFGVDVDGGSDPAPTTSTVPSTAAPTPPPPVPAPEPTPSPVNSINFSKIELKKKGDTINLKKNAGDLVKS